MARRAFPTPAWKAGTGFRYCISPRTHLVRGLIRSLELATATGRRILMETRGY